MSGVIASALIGALCVLGAVAAGVARLRSLRTAIETTGTVMEIVETRVEESEQSWELVAIYDSVVSFRTDDGAVVKLRSQHGKRRPRWATGDRVEVRYWPGRAATHAELVHAGRPSDLVLLMLLLLPFGLFFLIPATLILIRGR